MKFTLCAARTYYYKEHQHLVEAYEKVGIVFSSHTSSANGRYKKIQSDLSVIEIDTIEDLIALREAIGEDLIIGKDGDGYDLMIYNDYLE